MQKIIIIGCPGSGKTTLATQLGAKLNISVHHLDKYFWKENWTPTPQDEFRKIQNELMSGPRWILDGNFTKSIDNRLAQADTVVFLDFPKRIILWRVFRRYLKDWGKVRPDMGGDNEGIQWSFVKFILNYPTHEVYAVLKQQAGDKKVHVLHNPKEASNFLNRVLKQ